MISTIDEVADILDEYIDSVRPKTWELYRKAKEAIEVLRTDFKPKQPDSGSTSCEKPKNVHVGTTDDLISRDEAIAKIEKAMCEDGFFEVLESVDEVMAKIQEALNG